MSDRIRRAGGRERGGKLEREKRERCETAGRAKQGMVMVNNTQNCCRGRNGKGRGKSTQYSNYTILQWYSNSTESTRLKPSSDYSFLHRN